MLFTLQSFARCWFGALEQLMRSAAPLLLMSLVPPSSVEVRKAIKPRKAKAKGKAG